ncbi:MAG: response regulator [Spirochaetaceae bacterium]|nr:response regulator [Spirochaetaceae bacterium]
MDKNNQATILVIDDDSAVRQSMAFFLDDQDFITIQAENGRIGLEIFKKEKIDLILVDLNMPEVNGLEVLNRISKISPDTPMIVVSGAGEISNAVKALHNGAWDYLLKPIKDFSLLLHAVANSLEKAQLKLENKEYQHNLEQMVADQTEKISRALKEKEILLQEVNHRVKNNLNVITSLLNLKADAIDSKKDAIDAFKESRDLVYSMAMVHEELYQSNNFTEINIKNYIENLVIKMIEIYQPFVKIKYKQQIADVNIDIIKAIPCGMILTELTTNALKHAFNDKKEKGLLEIKCSKSETGIFHITVKDNGSGIPDYIDIHNSKSSGLYLVNILTSQIDGEITINTQNGTEFIISFPV